MKKKANVDIALIPGRRMYLIYTALIFSPILSLNVLFSFYVCVSAETGDVNFAHSHTNTSVQHSPLVCTASSGLEIRLILPLNISAFAKSI